MYGLPQAGKVASDYLIPRLKAPGYREAGHTPGLFKHQTNSIIFALVVDDFFIQYTSLDDFNHLAATLRQNYNITTDMEAKQFCGITLDWNKSAGHVTLSMPGYLEKALQRFTPIQSPSGPNMPHTHGVYQTTAQASNLQSPRTLPHHKTKMEPNACRKSLAPFSSTVEPSTTPCLKR
jgi:Reverse transcriptase (RNA-dependent DNA polymerase)